MIHRSVPAFALALSLVGCGWTDSDQRIVLVTICSLRADRTATYGGRVSMMPRFDELAGDGIVFDAAYTPAPVTYPALAGLMTGRPPSAAEVVDNEGSVIAGEGHRLAARLLAGGWSTGASVNAPFLDERSGILEGFRHAHNPAASVEVSSAQAPVLFADALRFLDHHRKIPAFAWIHVHDSHYPYTGADVFGTGSERYDSVLAEVDRALGIFLDGLDQRDLLHDAWVIVVADHGEALGADGERVHGLFLNDTTLHVPLIVRPPGGISQRRINAPVTLLDLAPTIASLAGLPEPDEPGPLDGRTLLSLLEGAAEATGLPPDRPLYAETYMPLFAYRWPPQQRLRAEGEWRALSEDAGFVAPTPDLGAAVVEPMSAEAAREVLAAAGDIAALLETGGFEEASRLADDLARRHPRQPMVALLQATSRQVQGSPDEALAGLEALARMEGASPDLWAALAKLQQDLGRPSAEAWGRAADGAGARLRFRVRHAQALLLEGRASEAVAAAEAAVAARPDSPTLTAALGDVLLQAGKPEDAQRLYAAAAVQSPGSSFYFRRLADALLAVDNPEGALKMLEEAERIDPGDRTVQRAVGDAQVRWGDLESAEKAYRASIPPDLTEPGASLAVAEDFFRVGELEQAAGLAQTVLQEHPDSAEAHYVLGQIELARREPGQAEEQFLSAIRMGGERATVYYGLARSALMQGDEERALAYLDRVFTADEPMLRRALQTDNFLTPPGRFPAVRAAVERYLAGELEPQGAGP
jgi:arylsulfatase A-like enzyme/cytochrome c-type biogenesis protein CcmH/NrfG